MVNFAVRMNEKARNILKYSVTSLIAVLFIWMVARKVDWSGFWAGLQQTRWGAVVLFLAASMMAVLFRTLRWREMIRPVDAGAKFLDIWDAGNVGAVANVALPGAGEFLRCAYASRRKEDYSRILGTIVMERVWDLLAICILIVLALAFNWNSFAPFLKEALLTPSADGHSAKIWIVITAVALVAAASWACVHFRDRSALCGKICSAVGGVFQGAGATLKAKKKGLFAVYTALIWMAYVLMSFFGLKAVPELSSLGLSDALIISSVGNMASVIPVPSGMGPYHYLIMTTLSGLYQCSNEIGLLYAVLCHESHAILIILLGAVSYVRLTLRKKK